MPEAPVPMVHFRLATPEDCRRIWEWRNEPATRESSFDDQIIPYEDHESWFLSKMQDPGIRIFIAMNEENLDIGYVRFNISAADAEISISVDKDQRGQGIGSATIQGASDQILSSDAANRVIAYVKDDNPASLKAFRRAGFSTTQTKEMAGVLAHEMVYEGALAKA